MSGHLVHRVVGAGAAGVAAVLAVAPFAHADPTGAAASSTSTPSTPSTPTASAPHSPAAPIGKRVAPKPADASPVITPQFGFQKIRIGVQIRPGAFVPPGTNTGNSTVQIVETGPFAELAAEVNGTSCQTVPGSEAAGSTETFCDVFPGGEDVARVKTAIARAGLAVPADAPPINHDYLAFPGDTVTLTQSTVQPNLVIDPDSQTVGPCTIPEEIPLAAKPNVILPPTCLDEDTAQIVTFNDAGLPPVANNDTATVVSGSTVDIDVLDNDVTQGAPVSIDEVTAPKHGSATPISGTGGAAAADRRAAVVPHASPAGAPSIAYKPNAGFVGKDSFTYTITTANGSSTATVNVTVVAPPPTAVDDSAATTSGHAVTIDVLGNDDANGGGALHVGSLGAPGHGTATISDGAVVYTSDADFVGTDTFTYTADTAFGSDTATVTVTVSGEGALSNTGSSDDRIAGIGVLLLLAGGGATVVGRRRYRAKHA